jgi:hypothetical protein
MKLWAHGRRAAPDLTPQLTAAETHLRIPA